jgi:hypothetical protein
MKALTFDSNNFPKALKALAFDSFKGYLDS